jgi:hypothetical protein
MTEFFNQTVPAWLPFVTLIVSFVIWRELIARVKISMAKKAFLKYEIALNKEACQRKIDMSKEK